ncbi:MAG: hypothetical protein ACPGO5_00665 [Patescibacteria group bacterium]
MISRVFFSFLAAVMLVTALPVVAESDLNSEISAEEVGESSAEVNEADDEEAITVDRRGMLIEIGNTTAEQTTIIVRVGEGEEEEDVTLEITSDTVLNTQSGTTADLSDWIAGDQIRFVAEEFQNSEQLVATKVWNLSFERRHKGRNGWIAAIRLDENEMDVEWADQIYTLDVSDARMVAGNVNPASLEDFEVGDRIRARVTEDGDGNNLTWDAEIVVVLRRGNDLFMRVTRWVVPGVIVAMPSDNTVPTTIDVEVLDSKFYEEGDVNNLVGAPGSIIQVDITEDTKLVRRFLGRTNLDEFSEGDVVRVIGRRDENTGHLVAKVVKNNNIQRLGVGNKIGSVVEVNEEDGTIVAELTHADVDGTYTVTVNGDTLVMKLGQEINLSDISEGDLIRVRGTYHRSDRNVVSNKVSVVVRSDEIGDDVVDVDELRERFEIRLEEQRARMRDFLDNRFEALRTRMQERFESRF